MPTLAQVQGQIDALISSVFPALVARQQNHVTNRNSYWHAPSTHSVPPTHTTPKDGSVAPDQLDLDYGDSFDRWRVAMPMWDGVALPVSVRIDNYGGPQGQGWVVVLQFQHDGTLYQRQINVGPEAYREKGWFAVVPRE